MAAGARARCLSGQAVPVGVNLVAARRTPCFRRSQAYSVLGRWRHSLRRMGTRMPLPGPGSLHVQPATQISFSKEETAEDEPVTFSVICNLPPSMATKP